MSDREFEEFKRHLADVTTAYECAKKVFENIEHFTIRNNMSKVMFDLMTSKKNLEELLEDYL